MLGLSYVKLKIFLKLFIVYSLKSKELRIFVNYRPNITSSAVALHAKIGSLKGLD